MAIEGSDIITTKGDLGAPSNSPQMTSSTDYQSVRNLALSDNGVYNFVEDAYFGVGGFRNGRYLVPHTAETLMAFERREDLAFYKNYVQPVIRAMIDPVFNHDINRRILISGEEKWNGTLIGKFIEDADGAGSEMPGILDDALTYAIMHGVSFVVIDNFPKEEQPETLDQAISGRILPMAHVRKITEVDSYECDRVGGLKWIVFRDEDTKDEKGNTVKHFSAWYSDRYEELTEVVNDDKKTRTITKSIPLTIGMLPVVMIMAGKRKKAKDIKIDPPLFDIARINHAIFNKDSEVRCQERTQGFSLLYVQEDKPGNLVIGRHNYISVPTNVNMAPGYATPPPEIMTALMASSESLREDLFRIANQKGVDFVTKQVKSGDALEWEFQAQETTLKRTGMLARKTEYKIIDIFQAYTNEQFDYLVDYPEKFGPDNDEGDLGNIDKVLMMGIPGEPANALKKKAFQIVTRRDDEEEMAKIMKAFDMPMPDTVMNEAINNGNSEMMNKENDNGQAA